MKKLQYLLLALPTLLLAACGGSDDGGASAQTEVIFTTEVQTRAASTGVIANFASGDRMSIYRTKTTAITEIEATYDASYNGTTWRTTPGATIGPEEIAYYFATYPAVAANSDATAIPVNVAGQTDYLYSGSAQKATFEQPNVTLKMRHAMAIIAFNIQSYKGGRLTSIKAKSDNFPTEGTLRITTGKITPTAYGEYSKNCDYALSPTGWTTDHPSFFTIPYTIGTNGLTIELTIDSQIYTVTLPEMRLTPANKYIFYLTLTEQGITLQAEKTETVNLMDDTNPITAEPYSYLRVNHTASKFMAPTLTGTNLRGIIYWGDEKQENYASGAIHEYGTTTTKSVSIDAWNVATVSFGNVNNIQEIDFSKF
ncbi:MAG: fimbrillin family protein [Rikenellaceae bacterium]|nr:fimbrillin family protein [Rikenellaceae bacterium]